MYSLHPGIVSTELGRHLDSTIFTGAQTIFSFIMNTFCKTSEQGAQTNIHCAVDEEAGKQTGLYYS